MMPKVDASRLVRDPRFSLLYAIGTVLFGLATLGFGIMGMVKHRELLTDPNLTLGPLFYACFALACLFMFALFLAVGLAITVASWLDSNLSARFDALKEEIRSVRDDKR